MAKYKWQEDGVGKIRLFHPDNIAGVNVCDAGKYERMILEGWIQSPLEYRVLEEKSEVPDLGPVIASEGLIPVRRARGRPRKVVAA